MILAELLAFLHSDVGFSTIVGSAVFNVLFVIGICALFAGQVLELTWYPLTRDSICYTINLLVLVSFIYDQKVCLFKFCQLRAWVDLSRRWSSGRQQFCFACTSDMW